MNEVGPFASIKMGSSDRSLMQMISFARLVKRMFAYQSPSRLLGGTGSKGPSSSRRLRSLCVQRMVSTGEAIYLAGSLTDHLRQAVESRNDACAGREVRF